MIVGKWVLVNEEEYYHSGCVTTVVGECLFIKLRPLPHCEEHYRLFNLAMLLESFFFDTEAELDEFMKCMESDTDPKLKIVTLGEKK